MNRFFICRAVAALVALVLLVGGCATSTDMQRLQVRISSLEKKNRELKDAVGRLERELAADREESADIKEIRELFAAQDAEFYSLRTRLQELKGNVEEADYRFSRKIGSLETELGQLGQRIDKNTETIRFYDKRLSQLETFMGMEPTDKFASLAESKFPEKQDLESLTEQQLYSTARQAFDNGDYPSALQGFELFLKKFANSEKADNARFWIGEIYFSEKWYEKAILEYEKVIKNYPEGNKVPGAYLKQGIAFGELGENANARLILQTLIRKYPDSNEAKIARKTLANLK